LGVCWFNALVAKNFYAYFYFLNHFWSRLTIGAQIVGHGELVHFFGSLLTQ